LLDEQLEHAAESNATLIVVDLDEVGFIDSSGLHVLLRHATRSSQDGRRLRLTRGSQQAQRLFRLTGTIDRLPFVDG
jgi:anti-anti-sigma factor